MDDTTMTKVMEMMKIRLRFLSDVKNHGYLFTDPDYTTELGQKFLGNLKRPKDLNLKILQDIDRNLDAATVFNFDVMNRICNEYVAANKLTTEDVFYLVRFALSGNPVGASMADIAEVIGKQAV
jgi:hypothetical protein